jgi:hypothetical protein
MDLRTKYTAGAALLLAGALLSLGAGCGNPAGPSGTPDGWMEYTLEGYTLQWLVEDSTGSLRVRMTAPTTGWVAVGFDPVSFMQDANLIIGFVEGGAPQVRDDFGTGLTSHEADTTLGGTDDVELIGGSETSGETQIEFRIPLDSGDAFDRVLANGTTYMVILAHGADGADDFTSQHVWVQSAELEI